MKRPLLAALILGLAPVIPAAGAEPSYLDDRSSAESLVRSLYNAIDRKEYSRAFSYFAEPPAKDLETYAKGYADTESVELLTGRATSEGAAGSVYYSLPVAIRATAADGSERLFAGCYTLRLANPQVQESSFTPLHIESGDLKPAEGALEEALPEKCGDGPPAPPVDAALEQARKAFAASYGDTCDSLAADAEEGAAEPETYAISFNYPYDEESEPKREAKLFRFWCMSGAYNEVHVYYLASDSGEVSQLQFATPELDIRYENDDPEGAVREVNLIGFTAQDQLVNSEYDEATLTLTSHAKWRGAGDASENGTWIFRSGTFSLVKYDVDASYDGEINPETVIDYHSGP